MASPAVGAPLAPADPGRRRGRSSTADGSGTALAPAPAGPVTAASSLRVRAGVGGEPVIQEAFASEIHSFSPAPWGAWLVCSDGRPRAGDSAWMRLTVGEGCCMEMRSVGPVVARPGPAGAVPAASLCELSASVANDAMLIWSPEPGVALGGASHVSEASVHITPNARLAWRDEFAVDRRVDGSPGTWRSRLRVSRSGWPVVVSDLAIGPGSGTWESPAAMGGARAVSSLTVIDPDHPQECWLERRLRGPGAQGICLPLSSPGAQVVAWGDDLDSCRLVVSELINSGGMPEWARYRWDRTAGLPEP